MRRKKFKVQLVVKGYSHRKGIDYDKFFSIMVRHTSIRAMLALVAYYNMQLEQMDIKIIFLLGELEEQIYMIQLKG